MIIWKRWIWKCIVPIFKERLRELHADGKDTGKMVEWLDCLTILRQFRSQLPEHARHSKEHLAQVIKIIESERQPQVRLEQPKENGNA